MPAASLGSNEQYRPPPLDVCPMFTPANVGRKSRAKPLKRFWSVQGAVVHPEEPTCLRQVKGAMNSAGHRALDGCPMFAPAYVGRKSRAKPLERFYSVQGTVVHPERSRGTCSSTDLSGKCFRFLPERSRAVCRLEKPQFTPTNLSSRPERIRISCLTAVSNDHACGSPKRETQELHQRDKARQEIRGSGVERSAVPFSRLAPSRRF